MPATATHAFFAEDVLKTLESKYQNLLRNNKKSFLMFAQSMDSMMFYQFLNFKKKGNLENFSYLFHTTKTNLFFKTLITTMKKEKSYQDPQTLAFVYGLICHFVLDSTIHPFVFYKTGNFNKKKKETYRYNSLHTNMETFLDQVMIEKKFSSCNPFHFKDFCFDFKKFSTPLKNTIQSTFFHVYQIENMDQIYYRSLKQMCFMLETFRLDLHGIKKFFYKKIDFFTPKSWMKLESLSYYHVENKHDYLNQTHKKWYYPTNLQITSKKSLIDLYQDSIKSASFIIDQVNLYFFHDQAIYIEDLFQNKSYLTGLDCSKKKEFQYFEF